MKHSIITLVVLVLAAPAFAADHEVRAGIEAANAELAAAVRAGDAEAAGSCYTEDAQLLPPNSPPVEGRAAIAVSWQGMMEAIKGLELETLEVFGQGDVVSEVGSYKLHGSDGQELDHGKYVVVWKKKGSDWKLHRDIFNTSVPPADQSPDG